MPVVDRPSPADPAAGVLRRSFHPQPHYGRKDAEERRPRQEPRPSSNSPVRLSLYRSDLRSCSPPVRITVIYRDRRDIVTLVAQGQTTLGKFFGALRLSSSGSRDSTGAPTSCWTSPRSRISPERGPRSAQPSRRAHGRCGSPRTIRSLRGDRRLGGVVRDDRVFETFTERPLLENRRVPQPRGRRGLAGEARGNLGAKAAAQLLARTRLSQPTPRRMMTLAASATATSMRSTRLSGT